MIARLDEGISPHRRGKLAEAEAIYTAILGKAPEDASSLHYLGLIHYQGAETKRPSVS